jgi:predicted small lipoprotein YifL
MRQVISTLTLAAIAALLPLAACDHKGSQAKHPEQPAADAQHGAQARLAAMPEAERNAVFIRAIRDASFDCQHVDSSSYQGVSAGSPTWVATCDKASNWVILIGSNGSAQVIKASEIEAARARAGQGQTGR